METQTWVAERRGKIILLTVVLFMSLISVLWMASENNYFVFDDSSLLKDASLYSYDELFAFYPQSVYLDRPIRNILLKWMVQMFGEDYTLHHVILILFHLVNTIFIVGIAYHLLSIDGKRAPDQIFICACITGLIFGAWPKAHMAVQWNSANNDLMGTTFALLAVIFFFKSHRTASLSNSLLAFFFYYLSIRTKEMFYPLPILFCIYDLYTGYVFKKKRLFISKQAIVSVLMMLAFFAGIVIGKIKDESITYDADSPYYQSFNPFLMLKNLLCYILLYFDIENGGFVFETITISGIIGTIILITGFLLSVFFAVKQKSYGLLLLYVAMAVSICTVLPLINQSHVLYLYFPSCIISILLSGLLSHIFRRKLLLVSAILMVVIIMAQNAPGIATARDYWLSVGKMEKKTRESIASIEKPVKGTNIYIKVTDKNTYTPFFYGPGAMFNLAWQDLSYTTMIIDKDDDVDYEQPYLVLEWQNNSDLIEIERNSTMVVPVIHIIGLYPDEISLSDDEEYALGIVPDQMDSYFEVYVDGIPQIVYYADDFISVSLSKDKLQEKDSIELVLVNSEGIQSEPVSIKVQYALEKAV